MKKIAAIQMCSSHIIDENLFVAENLIQHAAKHAAQLIVLPEMFALIGENANDKVKVKETLGSGKIQSFLSLQARKNKIWIVGGTIPIACENSSKVKAAALLFNDEGDMVARYDKMHLFDVTLSQHESYKESDTIAAGNQIIVIDTPVGKLGLAVCYDLRFPELFRCLFNKGAEIFVVPSAFTVPTGEAHWELLIRSRAVENFCYAIGACQGGTHTNGRKTYGHSMIVGPWGNIIAKQADTDPGVIYANIDLAKVYEARKSIPIAQHQRIFFDISNLG